MRALHITPLRHFVAAWHPKEPRIDAVSGALSEELLAGSSAKSIENSGRSDESSELSGERSGGSEGTSGGSVAEARLLERLAAPLDACPVSYVERLRVYVAWREKEIERMRARDPAAANVLVYSCSDTHDETTVVGDDCGGFADRIVGVVHLFVYAVLHDLVFFVDWNVEGVQIAPQVFHSPLFNWTWDAQVAIYEGRDVERERHFMGCPDHGTMHRGGKACPLMRDDPSSVTFPSKVTLTRLNKGAIRYSSDATRARLWSDLHLEEATAGGCLLRALVWPNEEVVAVFRDTALKLLDPSVASVALHVRTGDKSMHQLAARGSEFAIGDAYWKCAMVQARSLANASKPPRRPLVFFSTDDARYKTEAVAHYGATKVLATDVRPYHISKMQLFWDGFPHRKEAVPVPVARLRDTFGEWWLLSLAEGGIVSSGISGYSRTAFAFALRGSAWNMENYEGRGLHGCTQALAQSQLAGLGGGF